MISERQKNILWAVIEAHIKLAEPVGSKTLAQKRGFEIGAPMIRKEMNQLEQEGYLAQPHTSAGRVPTDKAYRLYIQEQMKSNEDKSAAAGITSKESQRIKASLSKNWPDEQLLFKEISRLASEISKELSVSGLVGGDSTFSCGFANLFDEPEFRSFGNLNQLMRFMDNMDSCFEALWSKFMDDDFRVLVGSENPFKEIDEFTLVTGKYKLPQGERGFVSIVGPKRMDYKRNMALVEYISNTLNGTVVSN